MSPKTNSGDRPNDSERAQVTVSDHFETGDRTGVTLSVVEAMASMLDRTPLDLEPLYYDVDPEALEGVLRGGTRQEYRFVSNGLDVTLYGDGRIELSPAE